MVEIKFHNMDLGDFLTIEKIKEHLGAFEKEFKDIKGLEFINAFYNGKEGLNVWSVSFDGDYSTEKIEEILNELVSVIRDHFVSVFFNYDGSED